MHVLFKRVTSGFQGLDGFRMLYDNISTAGGNGTAVRWSDTVGIAEYWFADIHKMTEDTPSSSLYIKPSASSYFSSPSAPSQ